MQIVIDISEEDFEYLKSHYMEITTGFFMAKAIASGTPLLKGHGRLIDADELKADIHMNARNRYATQRDVDCTFTLLNDAPTIIEADKED